MFTKVKTDKEIELMRVSGKMTAHILKLLSSKVQDGMTTLDLDMLARAELKSIGGRPAFLGYGGFPAVLCTSINEKVVHGIPRADEKIKKGDVVSLDFGVEYQGMITDSAVTALVGNTANQKVKDLIKYTEDSLKNGISVIKDGIRVGDISSAVFSVLDKNKLGVVRDLVGHGVGHYLHEEPNIPNYGNAGKGPTLLAGMTIAVEPMATLGGFKVMTLNDGWSIVTADGSLAAHFEDTILITKDGFEVLTSRD